MEETVCQGLVFRKQGDKIEILICQRGKAARNETCKWCIPGGHLEDNELPIQCVSREVEEETNISVKETGWHLVRVDNVMTLQGTPMVCMNYAVVLDSDTSLNLHPSNINSPDEISAVQFVKTDNLSSVDWAFNKTGIIQLINYALNH